MELLYSLIPVAAIALVAWFGKSYVESKASSLASKHETEELMRQQQSYSKELEVLRVQLQLSQTTATRRNADLEAKVHAFLNEVMVLYRESTVSTSVLLPSRDATKFIYRQTQSVHEAYSRLFSYHLAMLMYLTAEQSDVAQAAGECVIAAAGLVQLFTNFATELVPVLETVERKRAILKGARGYLVAQIGAYPGDEVTPDLLTAIAPHEAAVEKAQSDMRTVMAEYARARHDLLAKLAHGPLTTMVSATGRLVSALQRALDVPMQGIPDLFGRILAPAGSDHS